MRPPIHPINRCAGLRFHLLFDRFINPSEVFMKMFVNRRRGNSHQSLLWAIAIALIGARAHATGTGMPWETPLNSLLSSLTGPVAKIAGVAAVAICGLGMAFSEGGSGMRQLITVAFGLTIAFAATTFFLPLFGYAGGAAF